MTGFGAADGKVLGGRLRVEIRTVNHRYYNPQFRLPFELAGIEGQLRERLRQLLDRGHVALSARWVEAPPSDGAVAVDIGRARQVVAAATELKKQLKLKGEVDLAFVARQPDVLTVQSDGAATAAWSDVEPIVEQAAREVLAMEIALMADRVDITEELVRLRTHLAACRETLAGEGAVGKQLGFLAQELLREVNTIGSKANDAAITQTVIAMKGELEKFREQLENLE